MRHELEPVENAVQNTTDREAVNSVLIETEDDLEVEIGDVIRYVDLANPSDILTVQVTSVLTPTEN